MGSMLTCMSGMTSLNHCNVRKQERGSLLVEDSSQVADTPQILLWLTSRKRWLKVCMHLSQTNFFFSWMHCTCLFKSELLVNAFPHTGHLYPRPKWTFSWPILPCADINTLQHMRHGYVGWPLNALLQSQIRNDQCGSKQTQHTLDKTAQQASSKKFLFQLPRPNQPELQFSDTTRYIWNTLSTVSPHQIKQWDYQS